MANRGFLWNTIINFSLSKFYLRSLIFDETVDEKWFIRNADSIKN